MDLKQHFTQAKGQTNMERGSLVLCLRNSNRGLVWCGTKTLIHMFRESPVAISEDLFLLSEREVPHSKKRVSGNESG